MFSLRGGARTDLYTCLVAPPPSLFDLEKGLCVYTYGLYKISCTHMDTLLKLPLGVSDGKSKIFSSKIFLTKVLFLKTKASELSIC